MNKQSATSRQMAEIAVQLARGDLPPHLVQAIIDHRVVLCEEVDPHDPRWKWDELMATIYYKDPEVQDEHFPIRDGGKGFVFYDFGEFPMLDSPTYGEVIAWQNEPGYRGVDRAEALTLYTRYPNIDFMTVFESVFDVQGQRCVGIFQQHSNCNRLLLHAPIRIRCCGEASYFVRARVIR